MDVNIKSRQVDELLAQLRQLTGRGATEIVRDALEQELPALQEQAAGTAQPFDADSLYDADGLPA